VDHLPIFKIFSDYILITKKSVNLSNLHLDTIMIIELVLNSKYYDIQKTILFEIARHWAYCLLQGVLFA